MTVTHEHVIEIMCDCCRRVHKHQHCSNPEREETRVIRELTRCGWVFVAGVIYCPVCAKGKRR